MLRITVKCPDCTVLTTVRNKMFGVHFAKVTDQRPCDRSFKPISEEMLVESSEHQVDAVLQKRDVVVKAVDWIERMRETMQGLKDQAWKWLFK